MTDLATTLRTWRGDATQRAAAETLGVSQKSYEGWEQGRMPDPSTLALLVRLITFVRPKG